MFRDIFFSLLSLLEDEEGGEGYPTLGAAPTCPECGENPAYIWVGGGRLLCSACAAREARDRDRGRKKKGRRKKR